MAVENDSSDISNLRSTGVMSSYGVGKFLAEFFTGAFGALVFFYFEIELGLKTWMVTVALVIYSLWNAINDPIIGFLTEKPTFLSKKLGRRFPWIIFGALIWVFSFVLIFTVPQGIRGNDGAVFAWLVISICLYDTLYSIWEVNYQSTFVDKFRSHSARTKAASIAITSEGIVHDSPLEEKRHGCKKILADEDRTDKLFDSGSCRREGTDDVLGRRAELPSEEYAPRRNQEG